ncbi:MAG TPA: polysaccharide deacetylase family protein [Acidobacteriaceae bacterium]|jgi:peptidoglycan/xylan/chitin deacetylase (PgdA/CDA1 family)|nr:polysaccharide deacetylase family protein [Acidobacteriaceae bacterium]
MIGEVAAGAAALGLAVGGFTYASLSPTSQIFGRTLIAGHDADEVALTFDDGPNDAATPQLLDVLARHGVRATFFAMGDFARARPEIVRDVVSAGHILGNHTMSHPRLSTESASRIRRELADCNAVIEDITGSAVTFFRPPFGARRPYVLRAARELGLTPVLWNVTGYDWNPIGVDGVLANLDQGIARNRLRGRGSNLLLHDGGHRGMGAARMDTVRAVDRLLSARLDADRRGTGTRFVAVDAWARE